MIDMVHCICTECFKKYWCLEVIVEFIVLEINYKICFYRSLHSILRSWSKKATTSCWVSFAKWERRVGSKAWWSLLFYAEYVMFGCLCCWGKVSRAFVCFKNFNFSIVFLRFLVMDQSSTVRDGLKSADPKMVKN